MNTQIVKEFHIAAPKNVVWQSLSDPEDIVSCVPGASITEKVDDSNYKGQVVTKFGPIKASYSGDIEIVELDEANSKMVLNGKGLDSKGKGSAEMDMVGVLTDKDGGTDVSFTMDITIVGKLAQFGSRLISDVSDQLLNQFVDNFKNKLASQSVATPATATTEAASTTEAGVSETAAEVAAEVTEAVKEKAAVVQEKAEAAGDNALNAGKLAGTVFKSILGSIGDFFKSLFGGGKK